MDALVRLLAAGILPALDYRVLMEGYTFLRTIEHHLQMMHYQQTHSLPSDAEELARLALRLGFRGPQAGAHLLARYQEHSAAIRATYRRHLELNPMSTPITSSSAKSVADGYRHLARMDPSYATTFSDQEIERHAALAARLGRDYLAEVEATPLPDGGWRVTIVAYDYLGELSLICGLLFVYGFNILGGDIFTYELLPSAFAEADETPWPARSRRRPPTSLAQTDTRRKIVDVFTVGTDRRELPDDLWDRYAADLAALLKRLDADEPREAQGDLALRVANTLHAPSGSTTTLYPVDIEIDNDVSERYTVLRIDAPDTIGFLYEFTNALALNSIYIARMTVESVGTRVHDTLHVTNAQGQKITAPAKQRELRAAAVLVKHFTRLLPHSPNPETALIHFREFISNLFLRPNWPDDLTSLERPEVLNALARLLGVSDFLWDDFLRMQHDNLFHVVRDVDRLAMVKAKEQLADDLEAEMRTAPDVVARRAALNAFKDREMFRMDMRYIWGRSRASGSSRGS
jgi:glutamate-ammonia-ligase adenylyltransferase